MGCISSKAITRSMSIREEVMSHGFQSRTSVWEDLLTSHRGNNDQQLFAFVCSSNSNSNSKLKTTATFTLPSSQTPNTSNNNIYLVDLITDITTAKAEAEAAAAPDHVAVGHPESCKFTRSKSIHSLREKEVLSENRLNLEDKNVGGSRSLSFHTVEEYDALLERIHGARSLGSFQDWDDVELQQSTSLSEDENERCNEATISRDSGEDSGSVNETGWKRKAVAKGLKSHDISSSSSPLEFPDIAARIKQRRMLVQIYSPGT